MNAYSAMDHSHGRAVTARLCGILCVHNAEVGGFVALFSAALRIFEDFGRLPALKVRTAQCGAGPGGCVRVWGGWGVGGVGVGSSATVFFFTFCVRSLNSSSFLQFKVL